MLSLPYAPIYRINHAKNKPIPNFLYFFDKSLVFICFSKHFQKTQNVPIKNQKEIMTLII